MSPLSAFMVIAGVVIAGVGFLSPELTNNEAVVRGLIGGGAIGLGLLELIP